jgi:hypothetical protein
VTRLTDEYLEEVRQRKNRYMGQWTGTAGSLAADCHRLLLERETLLREIRDMQDVMDMQPKIAEASLEIGPVTTTSTEDIPADWILRGERELKAARRPEPVRRPLGAGVMNAPAEGLRDGSRKFIDVLDELKRLHLAKTLDYGEDEDALANIRNGADVVAIEPWKACLIRMADKMQRLKSYCHNGRVEFDGVEDTLLDIAAYAVISLVLHRESCGP